MKPIDKVAVIGLGYVGLPLLLQFCKRGNRVIGFDIDESKIKAIEAGRLYIKHLPAASLTEARKSGLLVRRMWVTT